MELIRGLHNLRPRHHGCVLTIGNFDGVHRGHQAVLENLRLQANRHNLPATVMVFEPMPREFFAPDNAPARLSSLREKLSDLRDAGADRVVCLRFDRQLASMSPEAFVQDLLVGQLGAKFVAVGDDFRFGSQRAGDYDLLQRMGETLGFSVSRMQTLESGDSRVSSSLVRQSLAVGQPEVAAELLGRPYRISGRVSQGQQLGRQHDVPTANLKIWRKPAPRLGVYAARVTIAGEDQPLPAVVNLGQRPSVSAQGCVLEAHLLDASRDLYGQRIDVQFLHFIRDEEKFDNTDALFAQIRQDVATAKAWFEQASAV